MASVGNGSSDDGEPGGTAGVPILTVLLNSGIGDIVAVVTRYFGGVKLGRGGLVRAYNGGARKALDAIVVTERVSMVRFEVSIDYAAVDAVRRLVASYEGTVGRENVVAASGIRYAWCRTHQHGTMASASIDRVNKHRGR